MRVVHLIESWDGPDDAWEVLWLMALAVAVRDGATAVHFHPWRTDRSPAGLLAYVVGGTVYDMIPPAEEFHERVVAAARELLDPGWLSRWWGRLTGAATVGHLRLVAPTGYESDWCGVVWSAGGVSGVDFHRLEPVPVVPPVEAAQTSAG